MKPTSLPDSSTSSQCHGGCGVYVDAAKAERIRNHEENCRICLVFVGTRQDDKDCITKTGRMVRSDCQTWVHQGEEIGRGRPDSGLVVGRGLEPVASQDLRPWKSSDGAMPTTGQSDPSCRASPRHSFVNTCSPTFLLPLGLATPPPRSLRPLLSPESTCDESRRPARSLPATFETEELSNTPAAHAPGRGSGAHGLQAVNRSQTRVIADEEDDRVSLGRLNVAAPSAVGDMLRLLSWSSAPGADKIATPEINMSAARQQRLSGMEAQSAPKLKRKRPIDSDLTEETRSPAKRRIERRTHVLVPKQSPSVGSSGASPPPGEPHQATMPSPKAVARQVTAGQDPLTRTDALLPDPSMSGRQTAAKRDALRRTIESQIGLEILLKHKELRLIDQELAKCQVALEQLRRCTEIAFPAASLSEAVSNGVGPALRTPTSEPLPPSPAPWGVTDGPYSRHYAKWLLPDSRFDGGFDAQHATPLNPAGKNPAKGRTRGTDSVGVGSKSRIRGGGQLKALSSGYPQPKDKAGLVIQKRKSDGVVIKLVCLDCRRENFSSAQGFINHCRIAHNRSFASHDAAADACGEPVEVDEAGVVVGNDISSTSSAGMVHPLIRSAHLLKNKPEAPTAHDADRAPKHGLASSGAASPDRLRLRGGTGSPPPNYRASPMTPHLSAWVKLKGLGVDLDKLVSDATAPVTADDSASDDSGDEAVTPEAAPFRGRHPQVAGTKQPVRSTMSPIPMDRSSGMKGTKRDQTLPSLDTVATPSSSATLLPRPLPSTSYDPQECDSLEPSPTNESNQAPSLVDDDEDYDPHSPSLSSSVSDDGDDAEPEFEIQDDEPSGPSTRTASATDTEYTGTAKEGPFAPQRGRPSAIRRSIGGREEKHVSFVSPSPAREMLASREKANDKKRKRS